jgi:hypothetical protein
MMIRGVEFVGDANLCLLESNEVKMQLRVPLDEPVSVGTSIDLELPVDRCFVFSVVAPPAPATVDA